MQAFSAFYNEKYCLKNYEKPWFKHWKCVAFEMKLCISYFDWQYLMSCANFHSVNKEGGQINFTGLTKYSGSMHGWIFSIKHELKLCVYFFDWK